VVHIEYEMQAKEWGDNELKSDVSHNLGDGARLVSECSKLMIDSNEPLFLQM